MKRMLSRVVTALMLGVMGLGGQGVAAAAGKYAIILQAGKESHEGMARAVHAFLYAKELKEHGHEVVLIFDGAGTEWAEELTNPESQSKLKPMYEQLKQAGVVQVICDFCAAEPLGSRTDSLSGNYRSLRSTPAIPASRSGWMRAMNWSCSSNGGEP